MKTRSSMKAVLFDLDGTLVNTEQISLKVLKNLMNEFKINLTTDEWKSMIGRKWEHICESIFSKKSVPLDELKEKMEVKYINMLDKELTLLPGAKKCLDDLGKRFKLCIVSGSDNKTIRYILEKLDISSYFHFFIGGDDYNESKPSPECFLLASKKLLTPPSQCVVIEDSEMGVLGARNAGMKVVGVKCGCVHNQDLSCADIIFDDLTNINSDLIENLF